MCLMTLCSLSCWFIKDKESWSYTQPFLDCKGRKNYVQFGLKPWVFKKMLKSSLLLFFFLWLGLIRQYYWEFLTSKNFNLRGYSNKVVYKYCKSNCRALLFKRISVTSTNPNYCKTFVYFVVFLFKNNYSTIKTTAQQ